MEISREERAKVILSQIRYVTISSCSNNSEPWGTPVLAVFDGKYNCYWTSLNNTQHSKNILENGKVYLTCFDSTVIPGEGGGVYIKAKAEEVTDINEMSKIIELIYTRKNKEPRKPEEFVGDSMKRIYKATPEKFWVNLDIDVKNNKLDPKFEIFL